MFLSNPRSMIASTVLPAHSAGTVPATVSQLVPHGAPHRSPTATGSRGAARPSATGTGSPGATQIDPVNGTDSG